MVENKARDSVKHRSEHRNNSFALENRKEIWDRRVHERWVTEYDFNIGPQKMFLLAECLSGVGVLYLPVIIHEIHNIRQNSP